jgi:C4-dicarboxylate-specific signal transduction histidine kinase
VPLQQVLFNLIMNAIEAMSAVTERERQLRLRAVLNERANVRVTVEDTGSGIDPAHIDRIFDPFFTTNPTGWAFPSAAQSSKRMAANFGHCHGVLLERASF